MKKDLDSEIASHLKSLVDHFDKEDRSTRERQLRHMRRLKLYWNNMSQIYWSESTGDYRLANLDSASSDNDQAYYDRPMNVYRAFLETIIAALSIQIPAIVCVPDDAENPLDLSTAKAGDQISELVYKHNNAVFIWLHALYVYCTECMVACYSYPQEDKKYGVYKEPKYKDEEIEVHVCPSCGEQLDEELFLAANTIENREADEFSPDDDDAELHSLYNENKIVCPECAVELDPNLQKSTLVVPRLVGMTEKPKARICLKVYGGLYVKIASYAKSQEDTPYLLFSYETHYANALEWYPHLRDELPKSGNPAAGLSGLYDPYEQTARLNPQYLGEYPENNVTIRNCWLRPASFNILPEDQEKDLRKRFPDGVKVILVGDKVCDYENENLDDCWTIARNPLFDFINNEPLGELLTNVQDIVNDLISLTLQTIEHGISQTWADPAVVNFDEFSQQEATPGTIVPTKPVNSAKDIREAFFQTNQASLSTEIFTFYRIIQELGQFISGALPSLFGGSPQGQTSRTASEYAMSRSMALQRLQTPWKMLTIWWKEIFGKVIPAYIKEVKEDERIVERDESGNFINIFIRKAEIGGKIGSIELEGSEQLPVTDEQKAEVIMQLMQLNNMEIMQALVSPENLPFIRKIVKLPEFKLPGEDDRQKQYEEIQQLLESEPISSDQLDPMTGQMVENKMPSVPIDPIVDNHAVEAQICRSWLVSEAGRLAKIENPAGYENVLLHMKMHMDFMQAQMMQQQQAQIEAVESSENDNKTGQNKSGQKPAPKQNSEIIEESDVRLPIQ